jgi:hypothetical protein
VVEHAYVDKCQPLYRRLRYFFACAHFLMFCSTLTPSHGSNESKSGISGVCQIRVMRTGATPIVIWTVVASSAPARRTPTRDRLVGSEADGVETNGEV